MAVSNYWIVKVQVLSNVELNLHNESSTDCELNKQSHVG